MCHPKNPLDSVPFVLNKKWLVNRGPNVDIEAMNAKWAHVKDPEKDIVELAESGLLESHTREGTQRFPAVPSALAGSLSMKGYTLPFLGFSVEWYQGQWIARATLPGDGPPQNVCQLFAITDWLKRCPECPNESHNR